MIDAVSSNSFPPPKPDPKPLTEEQGETLNNILSGYDANNLSAQDAKDIAAQLKDAGIPLGKAMGQAMSEAGFDAKEVGKLAGAEPPPPPSQAPQEGNGLTESTISVLV